MPCKHEGDIFPQNKTGPVLYRDPLIGWVVDVECWECGLPGVAKVDCKGIDWDKPEEGSKQNDSDRKGS
jgi:hypothetical protein